METDRQPATDPGMKRVSMFPDEIYPPSAGFAAGLKLLNRLGIEHIDLRIVNGHQNVINASDEDLATAKRLLAEHRIKPAGLTTPIFKCPLRGSHGPAWGDHHNVPTNGNYAQHLDLLPRAFALAELFGTPNIRCLGFWREYALDEVFAEVVDKIGRAAEIARAAGHTLYLKNEHNCIVGTGVELARVIRAVNLPNLVAIYDDGNTGRIGGDVVADYVALRGLIKHINLKHRRLDVMCGWMSACRKFADQRSDYRPYYLWKQPDGPFRAQINYGGKVFDLQTQRTTEALRHTIVDQTRWLLQQLHADGYEGLITVENAWDGINGRLPPAELEAAIVAGMRPFAEVMEEIWAVPAPRV
ncbi:MAG: TIM barrel protein [Lacunisphaera sp.]